MKKLILLTLTLVSSLHLSFAAGTGLSISPARYELTADKGKTVFGEFIITNDTDSDQVYSTSIENFYSQGETGVPLFKKEDKDIAAWGRVDSTVSVAKGEKKTVQFSVNVPDDAQAGGHFGAIFLYAKPPEGKDVSVAVGTKIAMLVMLTVSGDIKLDGDIKDFSVIDPRAVEQKPGKFFTDLPLRLSYRFTNSGNDRINPYGVITIKNTFGVKSKLLSANPVQGNVLPQSTRKFEVEWGNGDKVSSVPANYFSHAYYQMTHFAFGYYTAHLKIAYDIQAKKDKIENEEDIEKNISASTLATESSVSVFVFPWQLLSLIGVMLLSAGFGFSKGIKRYNRWVIKQAKLHSGK